MPDMKLQDVKLQDKKKISRDNRLRYNAVYISCQTTQEHKAEQQSKLYISTCRII